MQCILCLTFFHELQKSVILSRKSCQILIVSEVIIMNRRGYCLHCTYLVWFEFIRRQLIISKTRKKPIYRPFMDR